MDKVECFDKYYEPETEEHINGKKEIFEWLKKQNGVTNAVLEGWLPKTKQRPDIMFDYFGKSCVIEYQCSPISSEYWERHNLYYASGITDIWVCGVKKFIRYFHTGNGIKRLNALEEIYFNPQTKQFYIIERNMSYKKFKKIIAGENYCIMDKPSDYVSCNVEKYIVIKDCFLSYTTTYRYPSPTGKPSNKYPYRVPHSTFNENVSITRCYDLDTLRLKAIT